MAFVVPNHERERDAGVTVDVEVKWASETDLVPLVRLPHPAIEFWIVGFPNELP
jgi:hypothetical protein